jgi:archaellum component FlaC
MTPDERLERLTERHEALAQSVELLGADLKEFQADTERTLLRLAGNLDRLVVTVEQVVNIMLRNDEKT